MDSKDSFVSRRNLIAGVGAFAIVPAGAVRGSQANSKVSVGIVGVGNRGAYDASIVNADPRARITAVCDLYEDRIQPGIKTIKAENPAIFTDYQKLLASEVDAVIIATPPFEHPTMLEAAIQARKHVYCEKPMGVTTKDCKRVIGFASKADPKKCVSVGYQQRQGPVYLEAYKRLQAGQLGEITGARTYWLAADPFKRVPYSDPKVERLRNWFCYKDLSGDIIVEQDCHNLDDIHWFLGGLPIRAVGYGGRKVRTTMEILDHLSVTYEFPNGVHVNFEANQMSPTGFRRVGEEYTCTKGVIATSRDSMIHTRGPGDVQTIRSKRDITIDAFEVFIGRVISGDVENVAARASLSTMIAILGRTAVYNGKEVTWKGLFGS